MRSSDSIAQGLGDSKFAVPEARQAPQNDVTPGHPLCRQCGAVNAVGDQFCGDCGAELGRDCPACRHHVGLGDFCEACGHWMHEGKCRFCYAVLDDGAAFCQECGCSQAGLMCARCHTPSFFDFCGQCGTALSERASATLQNPKANVAMAQALAELHAVQQEAQTWLDASAPPVVASVKPKLRLEGAAQTLRAIGQETAPSASDTVPVLEMRTQTHAAAPRNQAAFEQLKERRLALSERLRLARERMQQLVDEMATMTFDDGQQARVHFMAFRQQLVDDGYVPRVWRCNRYSCEHPTPNDCSAPQFGGVWLIEPVST